MKNKIVDGFNHVLGRHGFDYSEITENIYIGTNMCCQFGFAKELLSKNVKADISLEAENIDTPHGVDYFLWLPTVDQEAPSQDKLHLGVTALKHFAERNVKVYIHCKNGHGRAPTLYLAYLIETQKMNPEEAFAFLKAKRPSIHLTDAQREALKQFAERR